ncbi:DUF5655 domain-containing protein [Enterococcus villorum]|uniref:DUF5655 domain-containing protein n=1 Tax=Enterococcus villorum TaxID=112904 RepID=UPI001FCA02C9|nr:DUF5655 domain-containing protein [Enterococcus villorum]
MLYQLNNFKMKEIKEEVFVKEKQLQVLIEENLETLFNLYFVASEFTVGNFRLDTVAYDPDTKSFVIIEYKKGKRYSVIDQGYAYLNTLLAHKGEFVLKYNECYPDHLKRIGEIDWSQTRIIFVANEYTDYQYGAVNNPNLPIDLVIAKKYKNNLIHIESLTKTNNNVDSIKKIEKESPEQGLSKEIKIYTEQEHILKGSEEIQELYLELKDIILSWDSDIKVKAVKLYNSFKLKRNIVDIQIQKNALKIWINLKIGQLNDSRNLARNVSDIGHWGNGDYEFVMKNNQDIEYIASLIKQSWQYHKKEKRELGE